MQSTANPKYRPRHPERTAFYRLFQDDFDRYVRAYGERFEPRCGPLRPVVVRSVLSAEKLINEILAPVSHRHWTFSIPRVLRGLMEGDRKLLGLWSQTA